MLDVTTCLLSTISKLQMLQYYSNHCGVSFYHYSWPLVHILPWIVFQTWFQKLDATVAELSYHINHHTTWLRPHSILHMLWHPLQRKWTCNLELYWILINFFHVELLLSISRSHWHRPPPRKLPYKLLEIGTTLLNGPWKWKAFHKQPFHNFSENQYSHLGKHAKQWPNLPPHHASLNPIVRQGIQEMEDTPLLNWQSWIDLFTRNKSKP